MSLMSATGDKVEAITGNEDFIDTSYSNFNYPGQLTCISLAATAGMILLTVQYRICHRQCRQHQEILQIVGTLVPNYILSTFLGLQGAYKAIPIASSETGRWMVKVLPLFFPSLCAVTLPP